MEQFQTIDLSEQCLRMVLVVSLTVNLTGSVPFWRQTDKMWIQFINKTGAVKSVTKPVTRPGTKPLGTEKV